LLLLCDLLLQAASKAGLVASSITAAPAAADADAAADATATPAAAEEKEVQTAVAAAAGEASVAHAVHQRLLAAACVQKQLAAQSAEFKRRFGERATARQRMPLLKCSSTVAEL
jgi:hypothetical protein